MSQVIVWGYNSKCDNEIEDLKERSAILWDLITEKPVLDVECGVREGLPEEMIVVELESED